VGATLVVVAALTATSFALAGSSSPKLTKVTIQLKWVTQSQFAGYYAAKAKGYYKDAGLDVNLKIGGPTIVNEQTVLSKQAEFGVNWFPSLLANRDQGNDLVNIAQVFPRSGTTEVTWKKDGIKNFRQMRGKKFGVWIFGNEFEQRAALVKYGMDPDKDVSLVQAAVRHGRVPEARDRCCVGNDVQRARPGARDEEPGHRKAVHDERPQGLQVLRPRDRHAAGRNLRPR
jgi:ABC-type nitrate/sulfonate/bicarbonate transport system substrate-binding protein